MKYTRDQKVVLFVLKHIQDLKDIEIIEGGYDLSAEGRKNAKTIIKSGFKPTHEEFIACLRELIS